MASIQLHTDMPQDVTMIPNAFLDQYMARSNGEFLKIYLYLLRWSGTPGANLSMSGIADFFNMTESDVDRALRFWAGEKLLCLKRNEAGHIISICLKPVMQASSFSDQKDPSREPYHDPLISDTSTNAYGAVSDALVEISSDNQVRPAATVQDGKIASFDAAEIEHFMNEEGGRQLQYLYNDYTGKLLSSADLETLFFFHRDLGMSIDLIDYLIEYCVDQNHSRMNYIKAVAIGWHEDGIKSVEEAKQYTAASAKLNRSVMSIFGIANRYLGTDELSCLKKWRTDYGFSGEMIEEACKRTLNKTGKASFPYADRILLAWKKNNVFTLEGVRLMDEAYQSKKSEKKSAISRQTPKKTVTNFHNFDQRSYNYDSIEVDLVRRRHTARN